MILSDLIRGKCAHQDVATATLATVATHRPQASINVASVATVAVANRADEELTRATEAGTFQATSQWWLIHFFDRNPIEVSCTPSATYADIMKAYQKAIAAEPFEPVCREPDAPMTQDEEAKILKWLELIGETEPSSVLHACRTDADARDYFLRRARHG